MKCTENKSIKHVEDVKDSLMWWSVCCEREWQMHRIYMIYIICIWLSVDMYVWQEDKVGFDGQPYSLLPNHPSSPSPITPPPLLPSPITPLPCPLPLTPVYYCI